MNDSPFGLEVEAESAYAVYDAETGEIVHLHSVTVYRGADGPPAEQNQATALDVAREHGHKQSKLEVLEISPQDLEGHTPLEVDLETRALKPVADD